MAVFMLNICKFKGCGITFPRLPDLIEHIEDVHIDLDPKVVEQKEASQPQYISLSYILKYISDHSRRDVQNSDAAEVRRRLLSLPEPPPVRSPTGSEMDEDETMSHSEDSNDSWTTVDEYNSDFILRYGVKLNPNAVSGALGPAAQEKPFACPVPGCKKRYKNVNGIKYHSKNGHKKDGKVKKAYKCKCGKSYKTAQSLKIHAATHAAAAAPAISVTTVQPNPEPPRVHVDPPRVHVDPPRVHLDTPRVHLDTPRVHVDAPRVHVTKMPGLVVTAAPARTINEDKVVRIYDTVKKEKAYTIPKISGVVGQIRAVTSAPIEKVKVFDRNPKVTVHHQPF